jgi:hypothetical protein
MSDQDIERRAQKAALEGAIAGIRKEFPNYRIMVLGKDCEKQRGAAIGHPTAMDGEVYIWVKIL